MKEKKIRETVYEETDEIIRSWICEFEHNSYYTKHIYKYKYPDGAFHVSEDRSAHYSEESFLALVNSVLSINTPSLTTEENQLALKLQEVVKKHLRIQSS